MTNDSKTEATGLDAEVLELIEDLIDINECRFDHHGYCQEHGWLTDEAECPHARAKRLLAAHGVEWTVQS